MGPQVSKPPQNMPSSSQQDPSTGATLGRCDGALPEEQSQDPGEPLHEQSRVEETHCVVAEQASGGASPHPPEELALLPLALLVLAPPAPLAPPELPDPLCGSTTGPHATSAAIRETEVLRAKGVIMQVRYTGFLSTAQEC